MSGLALTRSARFLVGVVECLLSALLIIILTGTGIARQQSSTAAKNSAPPIGQISGHVYSAATGAPLAKAVVTLTEEIDGEDQHTASVQTGSDGSFAFTNLRAGKFGLSVERCGFSSQSVAQDGAYSDVSDAAISLAVGQKREGIEIRLVRGGVISGNVTDQDGEPVQGLFVRATAYPFQPGGAQSSGPEPSSNTQTDDLGNFRLAGLNPGAYYVLVGARSPERSATSSIVYRDVAYPNAYVARDAQRVRVGAGAETSGIHITVRLEKSFKVRGHVHGGCQPDTEIRCLMFAWPTGSFATQTVGSGDNESNGAFEVRGLFPGEYAVRAIAFRQSEQWAGGLFGVGNSQVQVFDRDAEAEVSVGPLAEVSGSIVDGSSLRNGVPKLRITLSEAIGIDGDDPYRQIGDDLDIKRSPLDSRGRFEIKVIGAGTYVFGVEGESQEATDEPIQRIVAAPAVKMDSIYLKEVECSGRDYAARPVALNPGTRLSDCKIKIGHDTASITGKVLNGDKGISGQVVVVVPESPELRRNPRYTMTGHTDHNGQFSIAGIIPGDYLIFAVTPSEEQSYYSLDFADRNQSSAERVTFKPGETKMFVLKPSAAQ